MSIQAGVYYFDCRPITDALTSAITESLARYESDARGIHVEPGLLMVHHAVHVTREDELSRQPLVSRRGTVMTWDGRLDNRDALGSTLRTRLHSASDAEIALAAYDDGNHEALADLIGDWSLAAWHPRERTLVLASDYMGVRPLCYYRDANLVAWSTSLELLHDLLGEGELDDEFIVGHLAFATPIDHTPYAGIRKVPAAHSITFAAGKPPVTRCFWNFPHQPLREASPGDYERHLKDLLFQAVRVRLRSSRPVWAELSGGLDSSSIVCIADRVMRSEEGLAPSLITVSHYSEVSPESDERRFGQAVQDQVQRPHVSFVLDQCLVASLRSMSDAWPGAIVGPPRHELEVMRSTGARVALSGRLGDNVMANDFDDSASLSARIARLEMGKLIADARAWALATRMPIAQVLWTATVPLLPLRAQVAIEERKFLRRQAGGTKAPVSDVVTLLSVKPSALDLIRENRRAGLRKALAYPEVSKRQLVLGLVRYSIERHLESPTYPWQAAFTYPYAHRPLVEFVLSVPQDALLKPGQQRYLMKRALQDVVPARILQRFSKNNGSAYKMRVLAALGGVLDSVGSLQVVQRGFVDPDSLRRRAGALLNGSCLYLGNMLSIVIVEQWLRAYSARRSGPAWPMLRTQHERR